MDVLQNTTVPTNRIKEFTLALDRNGPMTVTETSFEADDDITPEVQQALETLVTSNCDITRKSTVFEPASVEAPWQKYQGAIRVLNDYGYTQKQGNKMALTDKAYEDFEWL